MTEDSKVKLSFEEKKKLKEEQERQRLEEEKKKLEEESSEQDEEVEEEFDIGGLTKNRLEELGFSRRELDNAKAKYGKLYSYLWDDENIFVFRGLRRHEWNEIRKVADTQDEVASYTIETATVFPKMEGPVKTDKLAGLEDTLLELIMRASGFITIDEALQATREL